MAILQNGSIRLFRVAGIDVMIHWSWIIAAVVEMQFRRQVFKSPLWNAAEFLCIFGIVLLHEIGHVTSCRQVGGTADRIILWPLGGIAILNPPPRPWPVFWSVAGGPLVNLALVPATVLLWVFCSYQGWFQSPDLETFVPLLFVINLFLLVFNLLPLYPNDGGQILYTVLWALFGRGPGLMMTSLVGMVGGVAVGILCLLVEQWFLGIFALMLVLRSLAAFGQALKLMRATSGPRHTEASCPACHAHPLQGQHWMCDECLSRFDTFETLAECPRCFKRFEQTSCPECGTKTSIIDWFPRSLKAPAPAEIPPKTPYRATDEWDQEMPQEYY